MASEAADWSTNPQTHVIGVLYLLNKQPVDDLSTAKINKDVGIHGLTNSFDTHLLEAGTNIRFIQELLGHNDTHTTLRYTQISGESIKNMVSLLYKL